MQATDWQFDIFVCGGSEHCEALNRLARLLRPHGKLHVGSCNLKVQERVQLAALFDVIHEPKHDRNGYRNFELFCNRDINDLAEADYFIKIDADVSLSADWFTYVEEGLREHPDAILFGPGPGSAIDVEMSGSLIRDLFSKDIKVTVGSKVMGYFYVAQTKFFHRHNRFMKLLHELLFCFKDGVRVLPSPYPELWPIPPHDQHEPFQMISKTNGLRSSEDVLRSLVVNAIGGGGKIRQKPDDSRIMRPHPEGPGPGKVME